MSTEANPGSPDAAASEALSEQQAHLQAMADAKAARDVVNLEASAAAEAAAGPVPKHHDDVIAELRRELSDLRDKNLRLLAEMENLRRRTEDEKSSAARYAITRFATDIVTVVAVVPAARVLGLMEQVVKFAGVEQVNVTALANVPWPSGPKSIM